MAGELTIPRRMAMQLQELRDQREITARVNVGEAERWASLLGGGLLAVDGVIRGTFGGVAEVVLGGALIKRGLSGHCSAYQALGIDRGSRPHGLRASVAAGAGVKAAQAIVIHRPARTLYEFWRSFENLPRIMSHLDEVVGNGGRSHWVARGPLGVRIEWDAEIVNEKLDELIAWRSLPGAAVDTAGAVHFRRVPGGTEVEVVLKYDPPAGKVGAAVARLLGSAPEQQIADDLRRFKRFMEVGAVAAMSG